MLTKILPDDWQAKEKAKSIGACKVALFLTDPMSDRKNLIYSKGSRADGTCIWIKKTPQYQSWIDSSSQILWVSGGPGKGKTMLSIFLAEELEQIAESEGTLAMQYFCDNRDEKRNTATVILRGLIYQLIQHDAKLFEYILPSFGIQMDSLFTSNSFASLWNIFENMVCDSDLGFVYCVLDGLDECDEASAELLLKELAALCTSTSTRSPSCRLKLIVLSREVPDFIPAVLSGFPRIDCNRWSARWPNKNHTESDIALFIDAKVKKLSVSRDYPEQLSAHVKKIFWDRAQGTFLWIGIVAAILRKVKKSRVREVLESFPPGLDKLYDRMLLQIDTDKRETAAKIILWVVMAKRPLTLSEVSIAIESEPSIDLRPEDVIKEHISDCGHLLTIHEHSGEVGLLHQSVKDYLLRKEQDEDPNLEIFRVKKDLGHSFVARKCLEYLEENSLSEYELQIMRNHNRFCASRDLPFLSYAASHWFEHARSLARTDDVFRLSRPFYQNFSIYNSFWHIYLKMKDKWTHPTQSYTLLHVACYLDLIQLLENLLTEVSTIECCLFSTINKRDSEGMTPLELAASRFSELGVRLLLENGAKIEIENFSEQWYRTARRNESIVRAFLETMAQVKIGSDQERDHSARVQLLPEAVLSDLLVSASQEGWLGIVRLMSDLRVNPNAYGENAQASLCIASGHGRLKIVNLLLGMGADINAQNGRLKTFALYEASQYGHLEVVKLLLDKGADVNMCGGWWDSALGAAERYGHVEVANLLRGRGGIAVPANPTAYASSSYDDEDTDFEDADDEDTHDNADD